MDRQTTNQDQQSGQRSRNPLRTTFASMAYRDFVYLWIGQVTHAFALWIDMIAQPLLILSLTNNSPVHLGLVLTARFVPSIVLGPVAGAVADSFNRRLVLLSTKVAVLLFTAIFTIFVFSDWLVIWPVMSTLYFGVQPWPSTSRPGGRWYPASCQGIWLPTPWPLPQAACRLHE